MNFGINYKIFAFGGNGGEAIARLLELDFPAERLYFFDTDKNAIRDCSIANKFQIGINLLNGKGTVGNRTVGKEAFKADANVFEALIAEDCLYILLGGLGGGTFSGMTVPFVELLSNHSRRFIICTSYSFSFEENQRHVNSLNTIKEINKYTDKLILLRPKLLDILVVAEEKGDLYKDE
jgi:cell division protein FtsZ